MIAGRLHWQPPNAAIPPKRGLAALDFPAGALILTEAGSKRRASLHLVAGADRLAALDPGGIEPLEQYPSRLNRTGSIGLDKIALIYQWLEQLYPISRDR